MRVFVWLPKGRPARQRSDHPLPAKCNFGFFFLNSLFSKTTVKIHPVIFWSTENCLDVHVASHPDKIALVWERDEPGTEVKVTYR